jgi:hypothetical protein
MVKAIYSVQNVYKQIKFGQILLQWKIFVANHMLFEAQTCHMRDRIIP